MAIDAQLLPEINITNGIILAVKARVSEWGLMSHSPDGRLFRRRDSFKAGYVNVCIYSQCQDQADL